jgi:hypothetical protein
LQIGGVCVACRELPDSHSGELLAVGTRLRLSSSVIVPRDLDLFLRFENLVTGRMIGLIEADPRTLAFFQQPAAFLQACHCEHANLKPPDAERLGGLACELLGDEYLVSWWCCACGAWVEELQRDALSGIHRRVFERAVPLIEERVTQARSCPEPANARCTCPAHQAARSGFA